MSDERILGDSQFVDAVISHSGEQYERKYRLISEGYDRDRIAQRVAEVLGMDPEDVFSKGRQKWKVKARSLLCFWASRELGISQTDLARRLEMSSAGVGLAVERGASIAREGKHSLMA